MTITYASQKEIQERFGEFHILTYAEVGFAPLNIHGESRGLSKELLAEFARDVNHRGEPGSLYPLAPISAVPRVFIRDPADSAALSAQIVTFLHVNREIIRANRVLCDFRTSCVATYVVTAIESAMQSPEAEKIEEVVIML